MYQVEVFCHNSSQKPFISQLLLVEVVNQEQYLDHIFFDHFSFEGWDLCTHLRLQQLHQNGKQVCVLFAVSCELSHDLTGENHSAFTQPVLDVCVNSELGRTVL